jgi:hypothetical protein
VAVVFPYEFDTSDVWRTIIKGVFALNTVIIAGLLYSVLISHQWVVVVQLALIEALLLVFARVCVRFQSGSIGTLRADRVVIQPNKLFWFKLPGPEGTYRLDRFSAIRVESSPGALGTNVPTRPYEVVWLSGRPGTPDIVLARTDDHAGEVVGREFGALLGLPVEETGTKVIRL